MASPQGLVGLAGRDCRVVGAKQKRRSALLGKGGNGGGRFVLAASLLLLLGGGWANAEIFKYDDLEVSVSFLLALLCLPYKQDSWLWLLP